MCVCVSVNVSVSVSVLFLPGPEALGLTCSLLNNLRHCVSGHQQMCVFVWPRDDS